MNQPITVRVNSIDILRALTMVLMIFVNDLWSLRDIPGWLEHTAAAEDGMGLADTVFPAFLFITGMSVPLAVHYRRSKGDGQGKIFSYILLRSLALIIMGLFLVNGEYINETATGIKRVIWNTTCCACFILIWNAWPVRLGKGWLYTTRIIGILVLLGLAWVFRGDGKNGIPGHFETHWWGILGLIGWAYLVSALAYSLSSNRFIMMIAAWLFFTLLCIASHAGWLSSVPLTRTILAPLAGGAMPALVTGGILTTMVFLHYREKGNPAKMMGILFIISLLLLLAGFYLRTFWGISKIRATPAWILICSAITIMAFLLIYWLADLRSKASWFAIIRPAGTNTLLCYLVPYFVYTIAVLSHRFLNPVLLTGGIGLLKSALFALLIVGITGLLGRWGLRLKL